MSAPDRKRAQSYVPLSPRHFCVVLVEPTLPANVGSVARAMNNLGVDDLRLVNPCEYQTREARQTAAHSWRILRRATTAPSLAAAVADCQFVIATTARRRGRHARITALPDIAELLPETGGRVALVFGRESSGLTNEEMSVCNGWVHIPTYGTSRSLNLAQAVGVVLYELSRRYSRPARSAVKATPLARSRDVENLKTHLFALLKTVGFLRPKQEAKIANSVADLIGRARLTDMDVRLARGFLHRVEVTLKRAGRGAK